MRRTFAEKVALANEGKLIPTDRGRCAVCLKSVRLRGDGTVGRHKHWLYECGGTGHPPTALDDLPEDSLPGRLPDSSTKR